MAFKHKFTYEEKVKIVSEYIDGTYGFREICKRYDISRHVTILLNMNQKV